MLPVLALLTGFALDLLFGDPHWLPHPVRLIGWLITKTERLLRAIAPKTARGEFWAGAVLAVFVPAVSCAVPLLLLWVCAQIHPLLAFAVESVMCYQILAVKSLKTESMKVYQELKKGDLAAARRAVSMIVGRDTENLTAEQVTKAAVETVAENTSDGVGAPLFYLALGGAPLGFFYKAVNTLDSMVGYKNDRYLWFGRASAKVDDVFNYLPSRLTARLMILAARLLGMDAAGAKRIYLRDRRNHSSPNSAQTEAVCAGALDVQLAGDASYFGKIVHKKTIGDPLRPVVPDDIPAANRLLYGTSWLLLALSICVRAAILFFL